MNKLLTWLKEGVSGPGVYKLARNTCLIALAYNYIMLAILLYAGIIPFPGTGTERWSFRFTNRVLNLNFEWWQYFMVFMAILLGILAIMLLLAFIEELIFRFLPLWLTIKLCGRSWVIIVIAIGISAVFGFLHGGYAFILLQGVTGFFLSLLFLKCGGFQKNYWKALKVSTLTHFTFNVLAISSSIIFYAIFLYLKY